MQEPLLFNESIKSNILFGNQGASDKRIREVAVMANALGFIQQNDQDLSSKSVQKHLISEFSNRMNKPETTVSQFKQLHTVVHMVQDNEHKLGYAELVLITEIVEHLSIEGLTKIESEFDEFIRVVLI